jgi:hypothetical protein
MDKIAHELQPEIAALCALGEFPDTDGVVFELAGHARVGCANTKPKTARLGEGFFKLFQNKKGGRMSDKLTDQVRKELQPEIDALAKHYFEEGKKAAASAGATASPLNSAEVLARRGREKQAVAAAIGIHLSNIEAIRLAYEEAGVPLE